MTLAVAYIFDHRLNETLPSQHLMSGEFLETVGELPVSFPKPPLPY